MESLPVSPEIKPSQVVVRNRGEAVSRILEKFRGEQKKRYGDLPFHNEHHIEFVRKKALEFAKIIMHIDPTLVTKETLGTIAESAAAHDSVLNVAKGEMITRFRGFFYADIKPKLKETMMAQGIMRGNEGLSADWLEDEMARYVTDSGEKVFGEKDLTEVSLAIGATYPEFDFKATIPDEEMEKYFSDNLREAAHVERYRTGLKIWQPHLTSDSPIVALAVASADLRGEVSDSDFESFRQSGNQEFQEISLGIREQLAKNTNPFSYKEQRDVAGKILDWIKTQISFALWQKVLFWKSVEENQHIASSPHREQIIEALQSHYNKNFDNNIMRSVERYENLEKQFGRVDVPEERDQMLQAMSQDQFEGLLYEIGLRV